MARYTVFFTSGGVAQTGLTPSIVNWLLVTGASAGSVPTVSELSAGSAPGWYYFDVTPTGRSIALVDGGASLSASERYVPMVVDPNDYAVTESRLGALDTPFTALKNALADAVWEESETDHVAAGSFGLAVQVMAGLTQRNFRIASPVYNGDGQMESATMKVYANATDAAADSSPLATFTLTATYDGSGNMLTYLVSG